jgi:hypothetical protein
MSHIFICLLRHAKHSKSFLKNGTLNNGESSVDSQIGGKKKFGFVRILEMLDSVILDYFYPDFDKNYFYLTYLLGSLEHIDDDHFPGWTVSGDSTNCCCKIRCQNFHYYVCFY